MKQRILTAVAALVLSGPAFAQSYEDNLAAGAATTDHNYLNVPFVKPENAQTVYTFPGNWPTFENRAPLDRSPQDKPSKCLI
jgi:hypothetical protein